MHLLQLVTLAIKIQGAACLVECFDRVPQVANVAA